MTDRVQTVKLTYVAATMAVGKVLDKEKGKHDFTISEIARKIVLALGFKRESF